MCKWELQRIRVGLASTVCLTVGIVCSPKERMNRDGKVWQTGGSWLLPEVFLRGPNLMDERRLFKVDGTMGASKLSQSGTSHRKTHLFEDPDSILHTGKEKPQQFRIYGNEKVK